ncbi:unnamed protein product [Mytilus coruscus]|uniref:DZIP3-like HEPN domain-containing protein n=1 Tax=Mytilus coruscus TaxID=42192 RepID=A0A6J8A263_MYTCO|nr:unnamed protein product [Mytilus coruscus]
MSDCIYAKSLCSEEGQIVHNDVSPKNDTTCRCDHKKNYSFMKTPRHVCYCIPTEEDCSCYIKSCPVNSTLATDYVCTSNSYKENPKCMDTIRYSKTIGEKTQENMEENNLWLDNISSEPRWKDTPAASILFCLCFTYILVAGAFVFVFMFHGCAMEILQHVMHTGFSIVQQWLRENLQSLKRYLWRGQTGANHTEIERTMIALTAEEIGKESCESVTLDNTNEAIKTDVTYAEPVATVDCHFQVASESTTIDNTHDKVTADEINFLRMVHLLFRVACPVVRLTFNHEIQPKHLRRTLNKYRAKMKEQYKKNENVLNNCQWDLLYKHTEEKPVKSDNFDISLMLYVLHTITHIKVGDHYPVQSDTTISAMLSKIKYIRNETTQSVDGLLSKERFNQYWDDVGQAVLHLVTQYGLNIEENEEHQRLLGRLLTLNPIDLDEYKVCRYICMSEKYPAKIIQKVISEYCTLKQQMIEDILRDEKHELYHKRVKTNACCVCDQDDIPFSTYAKIISERQWEAMYEKKKESDFHSCPSNLKKCSESFIPKIIDTCDLSVTLTLVLNTPDILKHIINRVCKNGFNNFLMDNKHTIYHAMENRRCCECCKTPTEKIIITKREWDQLFRKENDTLCHSGNTNCCCQYSVRSGINNLIMDDTFLSKIVHVAGPISVFYKIAQDSFLYYLNWTDGKQDLKGALTELLNLIEDDTFHRDMLQKISSIDYTQTDKTIVNSVEAHGWVSKHLRNQKASTDRPLQIIVFDKDGPNVKTVQIPKDFPLSNRTRRFNDHTEEETNFLVIIHALTKIVYPVIKDEFNTHCPDNELEKIRMDIYEQQQTHSTKDLHNKVNKGERKIMFLTQKQQEQLFSPRKEEPRNLDMELMIYILRRKIEEEGKSDYLEQLDVIDNIRREIAQSSCGVLNDKRFQEKLHLLKKGVMHFGKEVYKEQIVKLQQSRNIIVILVGSSVPSGSYKCDLKTDSGEIKSVCCADYEADENDCIACSKGYTSDIGQRCRPCPENTYGERCRRECSCIGYEICDNYKGCVDFQSTTSTPLDKTADITSLPRDIDAITNGENTDSSVQGINYYPGHVLCVQ